MVNFLDESMNTIDKHLEFVKRQIAHYDAMAVKNRGMPNKLNTYMGLGANLRDLLAFLEEQASKGGQAPAACPPANTPFNGNPLDNGLLAKLPADFFANPLALTASDLTGLPPAAFSELNISQSDKLELQIVDLINHAGGILILDKIIAALCYITGEVHQRVALTAKLYRMSRKGLVYSVPGKRGVYTTKRPAIVDLDSDMEGVDDGSDLVG
jgi:hypothetical protein